MLEILWKTLFPVHSLCERSLKIWNELINKEYSPVIFGIVSNLIWSQRISGDGLSWDGVEKPAHYISPYYSIAGL